ncbi:MAG: hypothetical protein ABR521_03065 [Gaiellaceae bacterium]
MRRLLSSPRRRRRLFRLIVVAVVAAAVGLLIAFLRNTGESLETALRDEPADVYVEPKTVPASREAIEAAKSTAYDFVRTAVRREHVGDSWALTMPSFRQGLSKQEWAGGSIPVIPYPADLSQLRYRVTYSYENTLGMALLLKAKRGESNAPMTFGIELTKVGKGARKHWLISGWTPVGLTGNVQLESGLQRPSGPGPEVKASLSTRWLAIPGILLLALVLVPVAVIASGWYRGRRAERAYLAARH